MKVLKIVLIIIGILLVSTIIAMFVAPTEMNVEKTIEINAPKKLVYKHVNNFAATNEWSPWTKLDPNMKSEVVGTDGTVGAIYKWSSENENVGVGEQEFKKITEDTLLSEVRFKEPFESSANAYLVLDEVDANATKVTWGFRSKMPMPFNIFGLFMDAEAMVGKDYQKGLDSLKAIVERLPKEETYRGYKVEEVTYPETHFAYVRQLVKFDEMGKFFGDNFGKIYGKLGSLGKQPGTPTGIVFSYDEQAGQADMAAAVMYSPAGSVEGIETATYSGKALRIDYYGAYEKSTEAHYAMDDYIKAKGLTHKYPVLEQYVTDPGMEPDTSKWLTQIYYFVE